MLFSACSSAGKKNRLATASSPYLQQHADNPVDWHEWNDEALATAKKENKPLLVSIGYASCHWCHVMEKESFMDTAVARIMNENFICIKVDREERPDIDNIYMDACQLISGGGGWPLNAFALSDGKPFFAGTYYSKSGWLSLLKEISKAYKEKKDLVIKQADALTKGISDEEFSFNSVDSSAIVLNNQGYQNLFDSIYLKTDTVNGGLKGSPKFPMPALTEFLLQNYYLTGNNKALDAASITLNKMALGGIYDHLDGGFARYATDNEWRIPHFEKMLYDNAQLISLYAHAYQITQNDFYKTIITETISFVERNLASSYGGYYSSLNADTEDGEGEFYSWKESDFKRITGPENLLTEYFNVSPTGNWNKGNNILFASYTPQEFSILKNQTPGQFISFLNKTKKDLLEERSKRNKPAADTKILTAWNAMMIKAYADAYIATETEDYLAKAIMIAKFLEKNMLGNDGSLKRNFNDGKTSINGFLDDYAWTISAFTK
ncbi:MAG TPA: thioredoxin domain-containing protein, partial [Chitinophagaceae bacterium]